RGHSYGDATGQPHGTHRRGPGGHTGGTFGQAFDEVNPVGAAAIRGALPGDSECLPPDLARANRAHRLRGVRDVLDSRRAAGLSPSPFCRRARRERRPGRNGRQAPTAKPIKEDRMPSIKTSLGLTICLTLALALGPVEPARAWTDPCASYLA